MPRNPCFPVVTNCEKPVSQDPLRAATCFVAEGRAREEFTGTRQPQSLLRCRRPFWHVGAHIGLRYLSLGRVFGRLASRIRRLTQVGQAACPSSRPTRLAPTVSTPPVLGRRCRRCASVRAGR